MQPLPIDAILPDAVRALREGNSLVVEAPPGAGKTTRVPRAILDAGLTGGEIVVLEPRRLAARLAARRVAEELGEKVGGTVGYQVRFEDVSSARTRIRFVTEGLLTRRLLGDPELRDVGAVLLDEFHERHVQSDLALAMLRRLQQTKRPDLKLVAMSATLDAGPVARYLGAPALRSEGRRFDVALEHLPEPDPRKLDELVAAAVKRLLASDAPRRSASPVAGQSPAPPGGLDGDVLVFLPGAAEIRRAKDACAELAERHGLDLLPLHGDLSPEEQDRAVRPGPRRKIILSTNVAETSVTIEGVVAVVDSGLARVASHSPWSGLPTLEVKKISRASAAQRAGRAGRLRPGRCLRLYTRHDHDARPQFDAPEIARLDLAEPLLALAGHGESAAEVPWFEAPPAASLDAATALLERLGALRQGRITPLGRRLLRFPLHPRLARLVCEGESRGVAAEACAVAALIGERDLREGAWNRTPPTGPSDLLELCSELEEAERVRFSPDRLRSLGLAVGPTLAADRARRQLVRLADRSKPAPREVHAKEDALLECTLAAFPDRVGRRRAPGSRDVVLAGGGAGKLAESSVVREAQLLVACDVEERVGADRRAPEPKRGAQGGVVIRLASAVTPEMLLDLFPDALRYEDAVAWNDAAERVDAWSRLLYGDLVLEESRSPKVDEAKAAALLAEHALARGPRAFAADGAIDALVRRVAFVAQAMPESGLTPIGDAELAAALRELCEGRRSFAELREAGLEHALLARLPPKAAALLAREAPERVTLPGGRSVRVSYEAGAPPFIESRLQDFFGLAKGPALAGGRVPLVLHLLAPNQRAVQVTTDLAGFWDRHYPALRKELMRRYPRHAWPEDPRTAAPPAPRRH